MGFAMYENMYTESTELESDLRTKIVHAYSVFIELAIEAIKYYKGGGPCKPCHEINGNRWELILFVLNRALAENN